MNRITKLLAFGVGLSLFAALAVVPASAQDTPCCQRGTLIEGNFGGQDVATLNPILNSDTASARVIGLLFPSFINPDPPKGVFAPNQQGAIVSTWDVSEDGKTYTFHLRDGLT